MKKAVSLLVSISLLLCMTISMSGTATAASGSTTVYITRTGTKYHNAGCSYLKSSKTAISLADAVAAGYTPCSKCCSPTLDANSQTTKPAAPQVTKPVSSPAVSAEVTAVPVSPGLNNFKAANSYRQGQFADVPAAAWYANNVKKAYEFGLVKGVSNTSFNPDGNITIAETIALASRLNSIYNTGKATFQQSSPWYKVYVDYAADKGIIYENQYEDMTVKATRAQFAIILANALPDSALKSKNNITDIPDVPVYAEYASAVYKLYNAGVLTGNDKYGTFAPDTNIQRSAVAAIVTRMADEALRQDVVLTGMPAAAIDLTGEWKQINSNSEDSWQAAVIDADTITIYWVSDNGNSKSLYWAGSFIAPITAKQPYSWNSVNDHEKTGASILASGDDIKTITYQDGVLSYSASALGTTVTIKLERLK
jgi:hypothetical protein